MTVATLDQVATLWRPVSSMLFVPHSEREYSEAVKLLDNLIDAVGEDETHPLASLVEVLGVLIARYEDDNVPELTAL